MDNLIPAAGAAVMFSTLLQLAKNAPILSFISRDTGKLNAALSVIAAGLVALGLSYNYTFDASTGAFTLGFAGTIGGLVNGLAHWAGQWTLQHAAYKGLIVPAEVLGEMRAILKDQMGQTPQIKAEVPPTAPPVQP